MRGFQVALAAIGNRSGGLNLENLLIDTDRPDFVFHGVETHTAVDWEGGRILGVL